MKARLLLVAALVVMALTMVPTVAAQEETPTPEATVEAPEEAAPVDEAPVEEPGYEVPDSPIGEDTMNDIVVGVFGTGGLLYIATQILKFAVVALRRYFPQLQPSEGFMGVANVILGIVLFGGISVAALRGFEVAGLIDFLKEAANLLLGLVEMIAGSTLYYMFFKRQNVPVLGHSLSGKRVS